MSGFGAIGELAIGEAPVALIPGITLTSSFIQSETGSLSKSLSLPLSSSSISSQLGTLTPSASSEILANLVGQSISIGQGLLFPITSRSLTTSILNGYTSTLSNQKERGVVGSSVSMLQSVLTSSRSVILQNSIIAISSGILTRYDGSLVRGLSGQQFSSTQGTLTYSASKGLLGSASSLSLGFLIGALSKSISGSVTAISQGSFNITLSRNLDGSLALSGQGDLLFSESDITVGLNGETILSYQGFLITLGKTEASITKVFVQGTEYNFLSINTLDKIISTKQVKIIS